MKCDKSVMLLYAVTDRAWTGRQTLYEQAEEALKGGITCLQLREKDLEGDKFYDESTNKMDNVTRKVLSKSIHKLENGNFGNCLPLKNRFGTCNSMYEMKIDYRDGYRIYFKKNDINKEIVVASAGIKKHQYNDVIKARGQLNEGFIIPK